MHVDHLVGYRSLSWLDVLYEICCNSFTWPDHFQIVLTYSDYPNAKYLLVICIMFTDEVDNTASRKRRHLLSKRV